MNGSAAIDIRDLHVRRGRNEVLHGIDVQVPSGSITGLLGPSGCGKTTLMRCVVGTQIVESGTVTVLGSPAGSVSLRSRVGTSPSPQRVRRPHSQEERRLLRRALRSAVERGHRSGRRGGLTRFATQKAADLSGGQLGRVSLACALVARPEILVLDEPTVGLDPLLRVELWERFEELAAAGTTLLVSSHVMDEAEHCASLLLMRDGYVLAQVSPGGLREQTGETSLEDAFLNLIRASHVGSEN